MPRVLFYHPLPYFKRLGLSRTWSSLIWLVWQSSKAQGSLCLCPHYASIMLRSHTQLGIQTQVIMVEGASTLLIEPSSQAHGCSCFCLDPTLPAAGRKT